MISCLKSSAASVMLRYSPASQGLRKGGGGRRGRGLQTLSKPLCLVMQKGVAWVASRCFGVFFHFSLQCRRLHRARANGFNPESAMFPPLPLPPLLFLPSHLPSGLILLLSPIFLCHRIKDGGFILAIRLTSFRPPKIRLHCRLKKQGRQWPFFPVNTVPCRQH